MPGLGSHHRAGRESAEQGMGQRKKRKRKGLAQGRGRQGWIGGGSLELTNRSTGGGWAAADNVGGVDVAEAEELPAHGAEGEVGHGVHVDVELEGLGGHKAEHL